jgi:hypothetical protein
MRLQPLLLQLIVLVGVSAAQETNFTVGPQYLVTVENTMLLRPIATPSLSLSGGGLAGTSEVPRPVEVPTFAPDETVVYLQNVYWGEHHPEEVFSRRLEPPSMTPEQTAGYMNFVANQTAAVQTESAETQEESVGPQVIELTGGPMPANLPSSIFDVGVTGMTDPQSLLQRGHGLSLGEVAAYWKAHKRQAPRVFTNQDMHRR